MNILRLLGSALFAITAFSTPCAAQEAPAMAARAWVLVDATSSARLAAGEAATRLPPASLTKLMTAYVAFASLSDGRAKLGDSVAVSAAAFAAPGRGGARMYLEPQGPVTVDQLLRGMLVASANDAAVALAEHMAGSVDAFVERMNAEARRLGMVNTQFANPSGQSDPQNYSTAEDLALLAQRLLADFPQFASFFALREVTYNNVTQANRNRLLWTDSTVDGMKTGQLNDAGWSIVATAVRTQGSGEHELQRRLIAVVLGAANEEARAQDALRLLNYGYGAFDTVRLFKGGEVLARPQVWKGSRSIVPVGVANDVFVTIRSEELKTLGAAGLRSALERQDPLVAPLRKGETVGRLSVSAAGRRVAEIPVVALERVDAAGLLGRAYDAVRLWWRTR